MLNSNLKLNFVFGNNPVATAAPYLSLPNRTQIDTANSAHQDFTLYHLEDIPNFELIGDVVEFWNGSIRGQKEFRRKFNIKSQPIAWDPSNTNYHTFPDYENLVKWSTGYELCWVNIRSKRAGFNNTLYYPVQLTDIQLDAASGGLYYIQGTLSHKYINQ